MRKILLILTLSLFVFSGMTQAFIYVVFLINAIYGLNNWNKLIKKLKSNVSGNRKILQTL
jgi:hypothetical protein